MRLFKDLFKPKPRWLTSNYKYQIEKAFELGSKTYYSCVDLVNIPGERAFTCIQYYNELDMKVDKNFLQVHTEAIEDICNNKNFKLTEIIKLNQDLKSRLDLVYDPDLLYKLASVLFFDETEDPTRYDFEYNKKKIDLWKKEGLDAFFLNVPLSKLLPSFNFSNIDSKQFIQLSQAIQELKSEQVDNLLLAVGLNTSNTELLNKLKLLKAELGTITE